MMSHCHQVVPMARLSGSTVAKQILSYELVNVLEHVLVAEVPAEAANGFTPGQVGPNLKGVSPF